MEANFQQAVSVQVIRASPLPKGYLKDPVLCKFCGNKRYWLIRCESCGRTEQELKEN